MTFTPIRRTLEFCEKVVPPGCRNPVSVPCREQVTVRVPTLSSKEAPVAIRVCEEKWEKDKRVPLPIEMRWWKGRLYSRVSTWHKDQPYPPLDPPVYPIDFAGSRGQPRDEMLKNFRRSLLHQAIIIDGQTWVECGEPRYCVMTFGLGCNHGGTALMTQYDYNSNIPHDCYFRIDKREEAIEAATETAKGRGDNKSLPIKPSADCKILIPEAVRLNPRKWGGKGDPFMNSISRLSKSKDKVLTGLGAMMLAFRKT